MKKIRYIYLILSLILFLSPLASIAQYRVDITATVPGCGDGIIQSDEECDGDNLGGETCSSLGFSNGVLSCRSDCTLDTGLCSLAVPAKKTTGSVANTSVVFTGQAYPQSRVILLKDGQLVSQIKADSRGLFQISAPNISSGSYTFALYVRDIDDSLSLPVVMSINVPIGLVTKIDDILISPTINIKPVSIHPGDNILISGQAAPESEVLININDDLRSVNFFGVTTNSQGRYSFVFNTSNLKLGNYFVRSRSIVNLRSTDFSRWASFEIFQEVLEEAIEEVEDDVCPLRGDFNDDCRVNIIDFSIMAYWYNRPNPPTVIDLNGDGKINLIDFSILAFYWTG